MHQASWFNHNPGYSTVHLVNSLLVDVANPGYYSGVSVGIESSGAGVFEPVGAGGHYLQLGSSHRNLGTSSIDGALATRLKRLTTYAPVVLTGSITQDTVLEPQAWRDVDGPDRGFHYETSDYAKDTGLVDIGLHYVATANDLPIDTDGDGLPDYVEDANGNLQVDPGETDWTDPFSMESERLDGEVLATPFRLFLETYTCEVIRDFVTPDRSRYWPDTEFNMSWVWNRPGYALHHGNYSECFSDPGSHTEGKVLYEWPWSGMGWRIVWNDITGWSDDAWSIERPPSTFFPIPWERCQPFVLTMSPPEYLDQAAGTYRREAKATLSLYTGGFQWPKEKVGLVVTFHAVDKTDHATVNPVVPGVEVLEPNYALVGDDICPASTLMRVRDRTLNADHMALLQLDKGQVFDVTPDIPSCEWNQYTLDVQRPKTVRFSWSRHPAIPATHTQVQNAFDSAARILATDYDERIRDDHPAVTPGHELYNPITYHHDSVPVYLDFLMFRAKRPVFPVSFPDPLNSTNILNFTKPEYLDVEGWNEAQQLRLAPFANVKVVQSIAVEGVSVLGLAVADCQPSMLITRAGLSGRVAAHECGHLTGLHRHLVDDATFMFPCDTANPSHIPNTPHLMNPGGWPAGYSINRHERNRFNAWQPAIWNQ